MKIAKNKRVIAGIGAALMDLLLQEGEDFLKKAGIQKGGMTLVENDAIDKILQNTLVQPPLVPGGSACNTVVGVSRLGGQARFIGKCGEDEYSSIFENDLKKNQVEPMLFKSSSPTGRVLSIITPDAQRSLLTYLGASSETEANDISVGCFKDAAIVHVEGYLIYNNDLMLATLKHAKKAGALISLDLASFTVVEEFYDMFEEIVHDFVDILIANEDEARAFTGHSDEHKAIQALGEKADLAVLKVGERGSYIAESSNIIKIEPVGPGSAIDTTGAGDLWASGFLFGLVNEYSLERCGQLGSACGYEVCQVIGADIPDNGWERIKKILEE
ncbi:MAG: adenosine kinase [Deltaproteobacteria bacterium]|nr:adenosine kinase [Deltaproteobacteria bacterium]